MKLSKSFGDQKNTHGLYLQKYPISFLLFGLFNFTGHFASNPCLCSSKKALDLFAVICSSISLLAVSLKICLFTFLDGCFDVLIVSK